MITSARCCSLLLCQLLLLVGPSKSSKILGYLISPSPSHFIMPNSLMLELAAKGHEVTVVGFEPPPRKEIPNYRYIELKMSTETNATWSAMPASLLAGADKQELLYKRLPNMVKNVVTLNAEAYANPIVERLKRDEKFDLVVFELFFNDFNVGLAAHFNCPAIVVSITPASKALRDYVGNPAGAAFTPVPMFTTHEPMTFIQRALNLIFVGAESLVLKWTTSYFLEPAYTDLFPPNKYPSFDEAKKSVALVLATQHFSQGVPQLSFPSLVEVSGMHIPRVSNELPKHLKTWIEEAKHGVIFFSIGSYIKSTDISIAKRDAILRVFARLPQRVLWKWEDEQLPGKPDNVMIQKWMPQSDILAHKNVRLFITHCGKGSINEARYHGVPILGMPVFADQPGNLEAAVNEGWAVPLKYSELNEEIFEHALREALHNSSYGQVVGSAAELFNDRPMHPMDTAVYWVEYVLRHKGAKHMQSQAVHLNWIEYYSLDVLAFFASILWIVWKMNVVFWKFVYSCLFKRKRNVKRRRSNDFAYSLYIRILKIYFEKRAV